MLIDILEYEGFGDPDQPTEYDSRIERNQQQCRELHEQIEREFRENPPGPLPREAIAKLRQLFSVPTPDHELMTWRLRLYCGHVIEATANIDNKRFGSPGIGGHRCSECGLENQTTVASNALGTVADLAEKSKGKRTKPAKAVPRSDEQRIAELEAELAELKRKDPRSST